MNENLKQLTNKELDAFIDNNDLEMINNVAFAHGCNDSKNNHLHFKAFGHHPIAYKVSEEQIRRCKLLRELKIRETIKYFSNDNETLVFIGMGMQFKAKEGFIGNHRIRARFINNDGIVCFIEFGSKFKDNNLMRCDHSIFNVQNGYNSLRERDAIEKNNYGKLEHNIELEYTPETILYLINTTFNCSFKKLFVDEHLLNTDIFASISKSNEVV